MNTNFVSNMDPNFIPDEYKIPYDVIELPSQGILYKNKKSSVKVEFLTTLDENILSSPNIINSGKLVDILLSRKVKDLGFDPIDLLDGDRMAILIFLRSSGFGEKYTQPVINPSTGKVEEGEINLNELKQKKLTILPNEDGEFDYVLPISNKKVKFRFLTGKDEDEIELMDKNLMERTKDEISQKPVLRLERSIMEIDGIRDKMKLSTTIKNLSLKDSRNLRKYMDDIEPGIDFKTNALIHGGVSVPCFLRLRSNFLWPEL
jgi:hypothetical protein